MASPKGVPVGAPKNGAPKGVPVGAPKNGAPTGGPPPSQKLKPSPSPSSSPSSPPSSSPSAPSESSRFGGKFSASDAGGAVLALVFWSWIVLPILQGGPDRMKNVLRAKFLNKGPKGEWLP